MSKPGKVLKALCKRLGVRLTVNRGKKRVYKSIVVLKRQCANKNKKKVKRKRKFGSSSSNRARYVIYLNGLLGGNNQEDTNGQKINHTLPNGTRWTQYFIPVYLSIGHHHIFL